MAYHPGHAQRAPGRPAGADSGLDVAFALAVLVASGQLPAHLVTGTICVGELGGDGGLRAVRDLPARLTAIVRAGYRQAVVPAGNLPEVSAVRAVTVHGAHTLRDLVDGLRGDLTAHPRGAGQALDNLHEVRTARAFLAWLVEPGDERLTELLATHGPVDALNWVCAHPHDVTLRAEVLRNVPTRQLRGEATRAGHAEHTGARVVIPEDLDWPARLTDLARSDPAPRPSSDAAVPGPVCLWVRGQPALDAGLHRSVTLIGARAATSYGIHVATTLADDLASRGWTVVASGAFGIDTAAHRGALAADAATVAVLPAGIDRPFPTATAALWDRIAERGLLVNAWPPGTSPTRARCHANQRLLGVLSRGTVVVEASLRSGALTTLAQAIGLGRPAMVVPGPVTSVTSAGCHQALRQHPQVRAVNHRRRDRARHRRRDATSALTAPPTMSTRMGSPTRSHF
jgi:DNA processing protein